MARFGALLSMLFMVLVPALGAAVEQVNLSVTVNYGSAYRDGTWVPVDVMVTNDGSDIEGWVEVRAIGQTGSVQSPIYRVPAKCPKGSRKRFRLHCHLEQTDRIGVRLFDGARPVAHSDILRQARPIGSHDYLTLVLDEQVTDYGFLAPIVLAHNAERRFYRENIKNEALGELADYPQCYRSFDMIILGDIDPRLIRRSHRSLLTRYVEEGGIIAVFTGANAARYRGTWVEDLMGVRIGPEEIITGEELAGKVFSANDRAGAKASRQGVRTVLTPTTSREEVVGHELKLLAKRPLGRGVVVSVGIDSSSHLLQDCAGYRKIWEELYEPGRRRAPMDFRRAGEFCSQRLPAMIGVETPSRKSAVVYLGLYFVIAIVGNWLVCNRLKRRELAWVILVICSIGFTGYAVIYGTEHTGKSSSVVRVEVLHIPGEGHAANLRSIIGIMTPRTSRVSAVLEHEFGLAHDVSVSWLTPANPGRRRSGDGSEETLKLRPFRLVEDIPARIDDLTVLARDLRLIQAESPHELTGRIEGSLALDDKGLSGVLSNRTGYAFRKPYLLFRGRIYPVAHRVGDALEVKLSREELKQLTPRRGGSKRPGSRRRTRDFKELFITALFADEMPQPPAARNEDTYVLLNKAHGPYLLAWSGGKRRHGGALRLDRPAEEKMTLTLLVCDIKVERSEREKD